MLTVMGCWACDWDVGHVIGTLGIIYEVIGIMVYV